MDANGSSSLVPLPRPSEPAPLVVIALPIVAGSPADHDAQAELLAWLWQHFCRLFWLLFLALVLLAKLRRQLPELRQQAGYWRAQHQRAVLREAKLAEEIQRLQGELRELKRRVFGRRSETSAATNPAKPSSAEGTPPKKRSRGQQPGNKGPQRRNHDHLPTVDEPCDLPPACQCCQNCQLPFEEIPGTADGDILEIEVRGHRRRYHRKRYRRGCQCPDTPAVITAPPPDKLIPKSSIGISIWAMILQHKFEFFQPLHRVLAELRGAGLNLPAGTITGGLQKITPLLEPLYQLLVEHNRLAEHWHCDETRWHVFVSQEGKADFIWYLWVFVTKESIVFVLDPTRAHDVPEQHLGEDAKGIASVDRYSAYKAMAQVKKGLIVLAFCWAHVRRDFLGVLTGWPELTDWAWSWLEAIGDLYERNDRRLDCVKDTLAFAETDRLVREQVEQMRERRDTELALPDLRQPQRKALNSLKEHWPGLTVFVEHPEVPMDNNSAERSERGPVVARKNFYGSGSLWSGRLAAMLFSLFQTVRLWQMDVGKWLTEYLTACAKAHGQPPPDVKNFMPWNMTKEQRERLSLPSQKPPDPNPPDAKPPDPAAPHRATA
jgi:transposase